MTITRLLQSLYGVDSYDVTNKETNIANIAPLIAARANPARAILTITNNSAVNVYLHTTSSVSVNLGYRLSPGSVIILQAKDDFKKPTYEYWVSAGADSSYITVNETILSGGD